MGARTRRSRQGGPRSVDRHQPGPRGRGEGAQRRWRRMADRSLVRFMSDALRVGSHFSVAALGNTRCSYLYGGTNRVTLARSPAPALDRATPRQLPGLCNHAQVRSCRVAKLSGRRRKGKYGRHALAAQLPPGPVADAPYLPRIRADQHASRQFRVDRQTMEVGGARGMGLVAQ